jgi:Zn-dependent metalloprotease
MKSTVRLLILSVLIFFMPICIHTVYGSNVYGTLESELLDQSNGKVHISYHSETGKVRFLRTDDDYVIPQLYSIDAHESPEIAARSFLDAYGEVFGIRDQLEELKVKRTKSADRGRSFVRFRQEYQGIPVIAGELIVQMDSFKNIRSVNGEISPNPQIDTTPTVDPDYAREKALELVSRNYEVEIQQLSVSEPELWIYNPILLKPGLNFNSLVWRMEVTTIELSPIRELVLIDAHYGYVSLHFNQINYAKNRVIYDNMNTRSFGLPGNGPVRVEGEPATGIKDVDEAYLYAGDTYKFYLDTHRRDSIDGKGMSIVSTVRYCFDSYRFICPYPDAFWNGSQMVYGEGLTSADDVIGHELTHGVTDYESNLYYVWQSGAINESLSDIWGEFVDLSNNKGTDNPSVRWLIGEDLPVGAIRDMSNPRVFNQPDRMALFDCDEDFGGVHINSGIGNKAAYLIVDGDTFNGKTITGIGITKTAKIYYEAQTKLLTEGSDYADLYDALQQACDNLVGTDGITRSNCQQVANAVDAVKMNLQPSCSVRKEAPLCTSGTPHNLFFDDIENGGINWFHTAWIGNDAWEIFESSSLAASGTKFIYGYNSDDQSDSFIRMKINIPISQNTFMHFKHYHSFDDFLGDYDGGVIEYSIDGGRTWEDAGSLFSHNGYNGTIKGIFSSNAYKNPLKGRRGFVSESYGLYSSRLNLNSLSGENARFRFRIGTDASIDAIGWLIDDVRIYTCKDTYPVYRFNTGKGTHFYTISETEKENIINNIPTYTYVGIGFYAYPQQVQGTLPVYRFNTGKGTHFYTISEAEKNNIINNIPTYTFSGVGFYAFNN